MYANNSETKQNRYHIKAKGVIGYMKTYKKFMNALAGLEKLVLEIATVLILVLIYFIQISSRKSLFH